jgi:hypothetical protein
MKKSGARGYMSLGKLRTRPGFELRSGHVGFVVDKLALGQVFSEYVDLPCRSSFHQLLHNHHNLSLGANTIGQYWQHCQMDLVSPPLRIIIKK